MAKRPNEELIEYLQRSLGDRLRVVVQRDHHGIEPLFVREDVARGHSRDHLDAIYERAVTRFDPREVDQLVPGQTSAPDWLLGMTGDIAVVLLYPHDDSRILVSFDPDPDLRLQTFVEECLAIVQ